MGSAPVLRDWTVSVSVAAGCIERSEACAANAMDSALGSAWPRSRITG